jgi:ParB-like chromosome segregation protein Spo0J
MANQFQLTIQQWDISKVIPFANNAKKHPIEQIDKLVSMIAEYGFDVPIVVDGDGVIIKGHGRLQAFKKLNAVTVPVVVRNDLTPAQVKAARIADNKIAESEWDLDLLKLELEELNELDFDLDLTGFGDLDNIDSVDNLVKKERGSTGSSFEYKNQPTIITISINFSIIYITVNS